jgi:hypothetical protein
MNRPLTITTLLLTAYRASGQGIVDFENFNNSLVYTNSVHNGPATGLISGPAGTYYFALLVGETNATTIDATLEGGASLANGGWVYEDHAINTTTPGLLNGNYTTDPGVGISWPSGWPVNCVVVGWSANIGTTYAQAKAWWNNGNPNSSPSGHFGISGIAQDVVVGGGVYPDPTIFGPTPGYEIQGFTLNYYPIPPPSPQFKSIAVTGANVLLNFQSGAGYAYSVQSTTNLVSGLWTTIASPIAGNGRIIPYLDVGGAAGSKRFYRLQTAGMQQSIDTTADPTYTNGWANGSNGGWGFGPWTFKGSGVLGSAGNGFFIGSSTNNASGASPGIDVSGKSWGIYANSGNTATAFRTIPSIGTQSELTFLIRMDTGYIDAGGSVGFALRHGNATNSPNDYTNSARFVFEYVGGDPANSYKVVDVGGQRNIGVPFTGTGLRLVFQLVPAQHEPAPTGYSLLVIDNATGATNANISGYLGSDSIDSIALFNHNAGSGPSHDFFFNSLQIIGP